MEMNQFAVRTIHIDGEDIPVDQIGNVEALPFNQTRMVRGLAWLLNRSTLVDNDAWDLQFAIQEQVAQRHGYDTNAAYEWLFTRGVNCVYIRLIGADGGVLHMVQIDFKQVAGFTVLDAQSLKEIKH